MFSKLTQTYNNYKTLYSIYKVLSEEAKHQYTTTTSQALRLRGRKRAHDVAMNFAHKGGVTLSILANQILHNIKSAACCRVSKKENSPLYASEKQSMLYMQQDFVAISKMTSYEVATINKEYRKLGIKEDYRDLITAQLLAIGLTSRMGFEGTTIELPVKINSRYRLVPYLADSFHIGRNLPVITLQSTHPKAPNWILFRGMSALVGVRDGALESMLACITSKDSLSTASVDQSAAILLEKIKALQTTVGGKATTLNVAGHSLGASLATATRLKYPDLTNKLFAFGSTGQSQELKEKLAALPDDFHFEVFNTDLDSTPSFGKNVLGKVYSISIQGEFNVADHHMELSMMYPHKISKVENTMDSFRLSRLMKEGLRSRVASCILRCFSRQY